MNRGPWFYPLAERDREMLERLKKLLEQMLIPQRPAPAPVPVQWPRRIRWRSYELWV